MTKTTNRDYFTIIAKAPELSQEVRDWAISQIEKMDARNAARTSKPSKTALANAPLKAVILDYLKSNEGPFTESELGKVIDASHNKAGSLARQLVAEGLVSQVEVKIPKVGTRKAYTIAK